MASSNPANFANLPKDELREIAAKGGHASHGSSHDDVCCFFESASLNFYSLTAPPVLQQRPPWPQPRRHLHKGLRGRQGVGCTGRPCLSWLRRLWFPRSQGRWCKLTEPLLEGFLTNHLVAQPRWNLQEGQRACLRVGSPGWTCLALEY